MTREIINGRISLTRQLPDNETIEALETESGSGVFEIGIFDEDGCCYGGSEMSGNNEDETVKMMEVY